MEEKNYIFSAPTFILLAIGLIALLGFAFLAIEGGRIYIERYQAQNAAIDAASAMCSDEHDLTRLESRFAVPDEFNNDDKNTISVNHPPTYGEYIGNMDYVEVVVSRPLSGGITNLVYSDQVNVTGRTVVICDVSSLMTLSAVIAQD